LIAFPTRLKIRAANESCGNEEIMLFEDMSDEWKEWLDLTPIERFRESEKIFAQYLAMGGSLDPDPDPTSPFYDPETSSTGAAYGRPGLRILRRGSV
jgi:hypothetical protein